MLLELEWYLSIVAQLSWPFLYQQVYPVIFHFILVPLYIKLKHVGKSLFIKTHFTVDYNSAKMGTVHQSSLHCGLHNLWGHCVLQLQAQTPGAKAAHSQPQNFQGCRGEGLRPAPTPRGTWANPSATWRLGDPTLERGGPERHLALWRLNAASRPQRHLLLGSWQKARLAMAAPTARGATPPKHHVAHGPPKPLLIVIIILLLVIKILMFIPQLIIFFIFILLIINKIIIFIAQIILFFIWIF